MPGWVTFSLAVVGGFFLQYLYVARSASALGGQLGRPGHGHSLQVRSRRFVDAGGSTSSRGALVPQKGGVCVDRHGPRLSWFRAVGWQVASQV